MKVETQIVWTDDNGRELLVQKSPLEFYIPLSTIDRKTVKQLGEACDSAMKQAKKEEGRNE